MRYVHDLGWVDPFSAASQLEPYVLTTPVRRLPWLERLVGVPVWAKLEFQQHTGSFKYRGAWLAVARSAVDQPVIAASAGNHGLAVAEAARRQGRAATICIPLVASRLKRERILATGADVVEHGNSLEEATAHAQQMATNLGLHYISPYNDPDVISGAAALAVEFFKELPSVTTAVVPVGGGGLVSGFAVAAAAMGLDIELIGCEPERYPSVTASLQAGKVVRVVHQPTLADGLAVNLEPDSITLEIARRHLAGTVPLSEEDLAAATLALLAHESLLVEPSGAAAVLACLRLAQQGRLSGPVAIPLCGGNLQHSTLAKVQRYPFTDTELRRLLDLQGRTVADTLVARSRSVTGIRIPLGKESSPAVDIDVQLDLAKADLDESLREIDEYRRYCAAHGLVVADEFTDDLTTSAEAIRDRIEQRRKNPDGTATPTDLLAVSESLVRLGIATAAYTRNALEWCSPSYAQSRVAQFFNTGAQDAPIVNYDRYGSPATKRVETQLLATLGLSGRDFGVTATSSGMAAYTLIESFLLRRRLSPGDTVVTAPYIYFEASEQLESLPNIRTVRADGYEVDEILAAVKRHQPRCLFIDPVANTAQQQMVDIPAVIARLREEVEGPITVVIDGTMISGALGGDVLRTDEQLEVIYYESCSKYLQLGHDASMGGVVVHPVGESAALDRLRRNTGTILYARNARHFPTLDQELFSRRMARICDNTIAVATTLASDPWVREKGTVFHPSLDSHPDLQKARKLKYAGGCVTFLFHEAGQNSPDQLNALLEHALANARHEGLHLTKGVSFGFSAPRISAAASMAESEPPFLRIYVGDFGTDQTALLAKVMIDAIINT